MAEYIEREVLMKTMKDKLKILRDDYSGVNGSAELTYIYGFEDAVEYVRNAPAADVAPVVHARWEKVYKVFHGVVMSEDIVCSACRREAEELQDGGGCYLLSEHCPHCGAKIDQQEV